MQQQLPSLYQHGQVLNIGMVYIKSYVEHNATTELQRVYSYGILLCGNATLHDASMLCHGT